MKIRSIIYMMLTTLLLSFLIVPISTFAAGDNVTNKDKVIFEVLPKMTGGTPQASGGMDLEVFSNYKPKALAARGFLAYDAIDKVVLSDLTGKWEGWKLTAEATPLENKSYTFPRGTLSLMEPSKLVSLSGQVKMPTVAYTDKIIIDDGQVLIAGAERNSGMGSFEVVFDEGSLALAVDENSPYESKPESGIYHTTLKWNLVSSDGEVRVLKSEEYDIEVDADHLYENVKKPVKESNDKDYHGGYIDGYNDAKDGKENKLGKDYKDSYYNNGYNKGYNDYLAGLKNEVEDKGYDKDSYNDGYDKGYLDGLNGAGKNDGNSSDSYNDGYNNGYLDGLKNQSNNNSGNVVNNSGNNYDSNSNGSKEIFGIKLPSTATNTFNFMLIGLVLLVVGSSAYLIRRKRNSK